MATRRSACAILGAVLLFTAVSASEDHSSVVVLGSDFDEKVGSFCQAHFFAIYYLGL